MTDVSNPGAPPKPPKTPPPLLLPVPEDDEAVDVHTDSYLRARDTIRAINAANKGTKLQPIPEDFVFRRRNGEAVSIAMHAAFENIGGAPALIAWAKTNPDKFYPLYFKMMPSQDSVPVGGTTINIVSAVPKNPLDMISIDETGQVVDLNTSDDLPE